MKKYKEIRVSETQLGDLVRRAPELLEAGDPSQSALQGKLLTGQAGQSFVETRKMVLMR